MENENVEGDASSMTIAPPDFLKHFPLDAMQLQKETLWLKESRSFIINIKIFCPRNLRCDKSWMGQPPFPGDSQWFPVFWMIERRIKHFFFFSNSFLLWRPMGLSKHRRIFPKLSIWRGHSDFHSKVTSLYAMWLSFLLVCRSNSKSHQQVVQFLLSSSQSVLATSIYPAALHPLHLLLSIFSVLFGVLGCE